MFKNHKLEIKLVKDDKRTSETTTNAVTSEQHVELTNKLTKRLAITTVATAASVIALTLAKDVIIHALEK